VQALRLPPRIKVLEALGSIADERIKLVSDRNAIVVSSSGDRSYRVCVDLEKGIAYSDDNGTRFRKYVGYPIIALLMIKGVLPYDERIAKALKGVPWRKLNEQLKRYALVEQIVKDFARKNGVDPKELDLIVDRVLNALSKLRLMYSPECLEPL